VGGDPEQARVLETELENRGEGAQRQLGSPCAEEEIGAVEEERRARPVRLPLFQIRVVGAIDAGRTHRREVGRSRVPRLDRDDRTARHSLGVGLRGAHGLTSRLGESGWTRRRWRDRGLAGRLRTRQGGGPQLLRLHASGHTANNTAHRARSIRRRDLLLLVAESRLHLVLRLPPANPLRPNRRNTIELVPLGLLRGRVALAQPAPVFLTQRLPARWRLDAVLQVLLDCLENQERSAGRDDAESAAESEELLAMALGLNREGCDPLLGPEPRHEAARARRRLLQRVPPFLDRRAGSAVAERDRRALREQPSRKRQAPPHRPRRGGVDVGDLCLVECGSLEAESLRPDGLGSLADRRRLEVEVSASASFRDRAEDGVVRLRPARHRVDRDARDGGGIPAQVGETVAEQDRVGIALRALECPLQGREARPAVERFAPDRREQPARVRVLDRERASRAGYVPKRDDVDLDVSDEPEPSPDQLHLE
jgi:hypothetical protein